jgi:hypothetical protein
MKKSALQKQSCVPSIKDAWLFYATKHGKSGLIKRAERKVTEFPDISFDDLLRSVRVKVGSSSAHFVVNYLCHVWEYRGTGQVQSLSPRGVLFALWYYSEVRRALHQECMSSVSEFYLTTDDIHMYLCSRMDESHE